MSNYDDTSIEWDTLVKSIRTPGDCIPIISNRLITILLFGSDDIVREWAEEELQKIEDYKDDDKIRSNLLDNLLDSNKLSCCNNLTRVAQFVSVRKPPREVPKDYLDFLKRRLLKTTNQPSSNLGGRTFSKLAAELYYPDFTCPSNPLRILADFDIPLYLTTSPHRFMEAALRESKKTPHTEVYCWRDGLWGELKTSIPQEYEPELGRVPTPEQPLVYHLHGIDDCPNSLVLTEDDHLKFLVKIIGDVQKTNIIPECVRTCLSEKGVLLLLGYGLHAWDLRVILQGLIESNYHRSQGRDETDRKDYVAPIQLVPNEIDGENNEQLQDYLKKYFKKIKFQFYGEGPTCFLHNLKEEVERDKVINPVVGPLPSPTRSVGWRFVSKNIRAFLTDGFLDDDLRALCFDEPNFKPVYQQHQRESKGVFIQALLEYAEQQELMQDLLRAAKERNQAGYDKHQPYVIGSTT